MNLYWGDIHNHCGITYGFGGLENALNAAKQQLDFCAVTGHAMWPDMPKKTKDTEFLVNFHTHGFNKLKNNWENVRATINNANVPNEFVTFQSYEMHSSKYGDYHIVSPCDDLRLEYANSPRELVNKVKPSESIVIMHHVGYTPGYRGGNWKEMSTDITPVVEVYSKHGCGMSDDSQYQYLHTMGPRDSRSTVFSGLKEGLRFGFVGSTDHHAGYPGSYGDGRLAVLAEEKTRKAIWDAILARRTYAITGDKIQCMFKINGKYFGSEVYDAKVRHILLDIKACDRFDKIVIYKNLKPWRIINGEDLLISKKNSNTFKVRVETGWGNSTDGFDWHANVRVKGGSVKDVEPCFRGRSVLAPSPEMKDNSDINLLDNRIISKTDDNVEWKCTTFKNHTTLHSATSAVILEIQGDASTVLDIDANGKKMNVSMGELLEGSRSMHLKPYNSEAVLVHKAVPDSQYNLHFECEDTDIENACDIYHTEIRQINNQMAWISPVFVLA